MMIKERQKELINEIDNSFEVKRLKELEKNILSNKEYNRLVNEFNQNKESYEKEGILNNKIIELRKNLFKIDDVKEYSSLEAKIRLFSGKVGKIISSLVEEHHHH